MYSLGPTHDVNAFQIGSYCYQGECRTHDAQCKKLWGNTGGQSSELCYTHFNPMGLANGNCGFDWLTKKFTKCEAEWVLPIAHWAWCIEVVCPHVHNFLLGMSCVACYIVSIGMKSWCSGRKLWRILCLKLGWKWISRGKTARQPSWMWGWICQILAWCQMVPSVVTGRSVTSWICCTWFPMRNVIRFMLLSHRSAYHKSANL